MPHAPRPLTRADLPKELTADSIRHLPIAELGRLSRPGNGVLSPEEQVSFDAAVHEVMSQTAQRVSQRIGRSDWADVMRRASSGEQRRGRSGTPSQMDAHLRRLATRIDQQVDVAEALAPGVDWSFAQADEVSPPTGSEPPTPTSADTETVADLEERLTEQVELVQVMTEIAEVGKRTYALEQQRDLQSTRSVFFGFVVSVAVLVAGWAPVVAADDWTERFWVLGLTIATCVAAGLVYVLVRRWQSNHQPDADAQPDAT